MKPKHFYRNGVRNWAALHQLLDILEEIISSPSFQKSRTEEKALAALQDRNILRKDSQEYSKLYEMYMTEWQIQYSLEMKIRFMAQDVQIQQHSNTVMDPQLEEELEKMDS